MCILALVAVYLQNLSRLVDASYPLAHYPTLKYCAKKVNRKKLAMLGDVGDL